MMTREKCVWSVLFSLLILLTLKTRGVESLKIDVESGDGAVYRVKRSEKTVTNMDIREAIIQLVSVIKAGNEKVEKVVFNQNKFAETLTNKIDGISSSLENKIDHMSTFLLRMKNKLDSIERSLKEHGAPSDEAHANGAVSPTSLKAATDLQTIASESFDILSVLPTYIEKIQASCTDQVQALGSSLSGIEEHLLAEGGAIKSENSSSVSENEEKIIKVTDEIKNILSESNYITESLYESVTGSYEEISKEVSGISKLEKILLDTSEEVLGLKRKMEFGVRQFMFKLGEMAENSKGTVMDSIGKKIDETADKIFENQNLAIGNLTEKVEKEIGLVWRQMGIMYGQVSNSISILEKVKDQTETYVKKTGKNLGEMEGTVEGLTDSMVNVDTNLNYMLGQLSLVVTEFNQVKTGLTDAMTEMGVGGDLDDIQPYQKKSSSARINSSD